MDDDANRPALDAAVGREPQKRFGGLSRRAAVAMTAGGLVIGGVAGGFIVTNAATSSTSSSSNSSSTSTGSGSGTGSAAATPSPSPKAFTPNENATHESGESAQREADENSGKITGPGGGGKPNEDPAHESGESSSRESAETSGAAPSPSPTP